MHRSSIALLMALALPACSAEYHVKHGRAALDAHDLAGAEEHFRDALAREPQNQEALSGLGWTYQIAGKREAARSSFAQCLEASPEQVECMRGLASVALAEGNPVQARELLDRATALKPDDASVQSSVALLELSQGNLDRSAELYRSLVDRFPDAAEYRLGLAEVLLRQKKAEEAVQCIEEALVLQGTGVRYRALLFQLQARALVAATAFRVNPRDCATTAPPVNAWLDAADQALVNAEGTGVDLKDLPTVKRMVQRRRAAVLERCPATGTGSGQPDVDPDGTAAAPAEAAPTDAAPTDAASAEAAPTEAAPAEAAPAAPANP